jgi:uncharacterized protein YhfF
MESFSFGDNSELADELLALVLEGKKTATTWAAVEGLKGVKLGKRWIVKDGAGTPRAVIETTEVTKKLFSEVDESIGYAEGEGDRTLEYWRKAHTDYFTRLGQFDPDMEVYCERFKLIEILK